MKMRWHWVWVCRIITGNCGRRRWRYWPTQSDGRISSRFFFLRTHALFSFLSEKKISMSSVISLASPSSLTTDENEDDEDSITEITLPKPTKNKKKGNKNCASLKEKTPLSMKATPFRKKTKILWYSSDALHYARLFAIPHSPSWANFPQTDSSYPLVSD